MQDRVPWHFEPLIRLAMGICLLLGASGIAALMVLKQMNMDQDAAAFPSLVIHSLVFHGGIIALVHLFIKEHGMSWREAFGLRLSAGGRFYGLVLLGAVVCVVNAQLLGNLSAFVIETVTGKEAEMQGAVELLRRTNSSWQVLYMAVVTVVMAPVGEEILFRGILFAALRQTKGRWVAFGVSSVAFGVIHANMLSLVPLIVMAVLLAWVYERTRNLLAPIFVHALFNLTSFLMLLSEP